MPEEEEEPHISTLLLKKGKAKAKAPPPAPMHKSMCVIRPSYYITHILQGEGTSAGQDIEQSPSHTPSEAEHCWYHPDWSRLSASYVHLVNPSTPDFTFIAETEVLMNVAANDSSASNDPKTLTEAQSQPDWP